MQQFTDGLAETNSIMYLSETPWCKASVTPFGLKTKNKSGRREPTHAGHGVQVVVITDHPEKLE